MKKLFLVSALALGSLTTFAQDTEEVQAEAMEVMEAQDTFAAIDLSELPEAITEALAKDHPNAQITKAYLNEEAQYKLEVTKEDGSEVELYADEEGNWLEM
ncbi:MAG: hypothetical protein KJN76_13660 [Eudoraea sp.]|nr:hypothetical protein [Eudoraea sp.]